MMRAESLALSFPLELVSLGPCRRILLVVGIHAFAAGCHKVEEPHALAAPPSASSTASASLAAPAVKAEKVRVRFRSPLAVEFRPRITATGNLRPHQSAPLAFPVAGVLEQVRVKRGQAVSAGAILAVLDDAAARASLAQAEAGVAAAEAQLRSASDQYTRLTMVRKAEGISASQHFQVESQRDLAAAQAMAARAQLAQARVLLRHHTLRSPFNGLVTRVPEGVGFAVSPAVPLFAVETIRLLVLETSVTQEEATDLRVGMAVFVTVSATGETTSTTSESAERRARIRVIVPSIDTATNRVPIEIDVPNPDDRFKPHAFARVEAEGAPRTAWRIPPASLTQREGAFAAWIEGRDGRVRTTRVRVLGEQDGWPVVVPSGEERWTEQTRIVEAPPLGLTDGAEIAVDDATP